MSPLISKLTYTDMPTNQYFHMNIAKHGLLIPTSTQSWSSAPFVGEGETKPIHALTFTHFL